MINPTDPTKIQTRYRLSKEETKILKDAGVTLLEEAHELLTRGLNSLSEEDLRTRRASLQRIAADLTPEHLTDSSSGRRSRPGMGGAGVPLNIADTPVNITNVLVNIAAHLQPQQRPNLKNELEVDLLRHLRDQGFLTDWPAEDQGKRNTCVAFAVTACLELQLAIRDRTKPRLLSPQFLYWHMRTAIDAETSVPGWDEGATKLAHAKEVLRRFGICAWRDSRYFRTTAADETHTGPEPTDAAKQKARRLLVSQGDYSDFPARESRPPMGGVAQQVYDQLSLNGRPVAVGLAVYKIPTEEGDSDNWWYDNEALGGDPRDNGIIRGPDEPGSKIPPGRTPYDGSDTVGHVVCIVGFQPDRNEPTGGWFLFRNSWGIGYPSNPADGPPPPIVRDLGYGALSATYVENSCWEWYSPELA